MILDSILKIANAVAHTRPKRPPTLIIRHDGVKREIRFSSAVVIAAKFLGVATPDMSDRKAVCTLLRSAVRTLKKTRTTQANSLDVILDARKGKELIGLAGDYLRAISRHQTTPSPQSLGVFIDTVLHGGYTKVLVDTKRERNALGMFLAKRGSPIVVVVYPRESTTGDVEWSAPTVAHEGGLGG